jgi:hypothetical protein
VRDEFRVDRGRIRKRVRLRARFDAKVAHYRQLPP